MAGRLAAAAGALVELGLGTSFVGGADTANGAGAVDAAAIASAWSFCAVSWPLRLLTACKAQTTTITSNAPAAMVLQDQG